MQPAMEKVAKAYTEKTGMRVDLVVASSGKLSAQIANGAPYHVFASADERYPSYLHGQGLTLGEPLPFAEGQLVLWTLEDSCPSLEDLKLDARARLALANPALAPYGRAASEALEQTGLGEDWLVYGEHVGQVNLFVESGATKYGLTALSTLRSEETIDLGTLHAIPVDWYTPILHTAVAIKQDEAMSGHALDFVAFLQSEVAIGLLEQYGFQVVGQH